MQTPGKAETQGGLQRSFVIAFLLNFLSSRLLAYSRKCVCLCSFVGGGTANEKRLDVLSDGGRREQHTVVGCVEERRLEKEIVGWL